LYEFIENQKTTRDLKNNTIQKESVSEIKTPPKETKKKVKPKKAVKENLLQKQKIKKAPKELSFSEWAKFLKTKQVITKEKPTLEDKFQLIDSFLENTKRIVPDKNTKNTVDLSEKSWASTDELMTETLAKVFVKQKKYDKALQAFQILGLKYPEKNSFFADQIKEIKRLQKLKD